MSKASGAKKEGEVFTAIQIKVRGIGPGESDDKGMSRIRDLFVE